MKQEKNIAMYVRVGSYEQLDNPIEHIIERAKQGEIKTLIVGTLEKICEDPVRRQELIKELTDYGVKIVTAFEEDNPSRKCAIYNRYSVNDPKRLAETRGKLIAYCEETLGIHDYELFEEVGSVLEKREVFDGMMARIDKGEFSDLLVCHADRIYKPGYDPAYFAELVATTRAKVVIHTMN